MKKEFNITGVCFPKRHYMMDTRGKMAAIMDMVEQRHYIIINRPQQHGVTTVFHHLENTLCSFEQYLPIRLILHGFESKWNESEEAFVAVILSQIKKIVRYTEPSLANFLERFSAKPYNLKDLSAFMSDLAQEAKKKLVLLFDEVNVCSYSSLFLSFLTQSVQFSTFHSIVLTGVRDIKSLKSKMRSTASTSNAYTTT